MHEGSVGNLGEPKASSGAKDRNQRVRPVEQHPGAGAAISSRRRAKVGNRPEVGRRNATNGVPPEAPGSRSGFKVARKAGERRPPEPGRSLGVGKGAVPVMGCGWATGWAH
jgi:hypothetical protein